MSEVTQAFHSVLSRMHKSKPSLMGQLQTCGQESIKIRTSTTAQKLRFNKVIIQSQPSCPPPLPTQATAARINSLSPGRNLERDQVHPSDGCLLLILSGWMKQRMTVLNCFRSPLCCQRGRNSSRPLKVRCACHINEANDYRTLDPTLICL